MDIPQMKSGAGRDLLKSEFKRFAEALEDLTGVKLSLENLKKGIETVNEKRKAILRLAKLRVANPVPISGLDVLLANQVYFYDNPERFTSSVNAICDELEKRIEDGVGVFAKDAPRILISGCPMAIPNWKISIPSAPQVIGALGCACC